MFNDRELQVRLARMPADVVTRARVLIASGWPLEAQRVLLEHTHDGREASELVASLYRRMVIHE